jgi:hypothetical protein
LDEATVASLLKRNVVQLHKGADGKIDKAAVKTPEATIGVAARLGRLDLNERFGVPKPLCVRSDHYMSSNIVKTHRPLWAARPRLRYVA